MNIILLGPDIKLDRPLRSAEADGFTGQIGIQSLVQLDLEKLDYKEAAQWRTATFNHQVATTPGMEENTRLASVMQRDKMLANLGVAEPEPIAA